MEKLKIQLLETDSLNRDNNYYLYEITTNTSHYYISRSDEDLSKMEQDVQDYSNEYEMHKREDFTDREWEIAKYLFFFLWDSSNGTNTCIDQDIYEDDGFTQEEISQFINKFNFDMLGVLEDYDDGSFELYWDYFSCFDLNSCNFWEK